MVLMMRVWLRPSLAEVITEKYYIPHSSLTISYSGVPSSLFRLTPTTEISNIELGAEAGSFGATLILENRGGVCGKGSRRGGDGIRYND